MIRFKLKYGLLIIIGACAILCVGCAKSLISVETKPDPNAYSMFGRTANREFFVNALLSDSIKLKWEAETNGSSPPTSVIISDNYVFLSDLSGRIYCFDINTGKTAGQLRSKGSVFAAPVIKDVWVIYVYAKPDDNSSALVIYNFASGTLIAEADDIKGRVVTEIIKTDEGIVFITDTGRLYIYNYNGKQQHEYNFREYSHSSPALSGNVVIFGTDKGEIIGYNIKNRKLEYREKISGVLISGVSVSGNTAFTSDYNGHVFGIDVNTGKVNWSYDTGNRISMIPAYDETNVYVGNLHGDLFAINKSDGSLAWRRNTGGVLNASPLVSDSIIVVPDYYEKIHFVNKEEGTITKSVSYEGRVRLTPVYFRNLLFIGYGNGILDAYEVL